MVGKRELRGTRLSMELVLAHLTHTHDLDELLADYPELTCEGVQVVLAYVQQAVGCGRLPREAVER